MNLKAKVKPLVATIVIVLAVLEVNSMVLHKQCASFDVVPGD